MAILPAEFIQRCKRGEPVQKTDVETFVRGYVSGDVPDYQMAAWLMAVCFQPLDPVETSWLTQAMVNSGRKLTFKNRMDLTVDKHSTGGVGDKTSLILAPIVAAAGLRVPMLAGRGLGHTGGTLDKLEAIAGMNVHLSLEQFQSQVEQLGVAISGQTEEICPADRKMYALRDVTATVDSQPLICASVMSKKIAEGCQALVLDVKFGSGAFLKKLEDSELLGRSLIEIGVAAGLKVQVLLTNMNDPLGRFVGNAVEVQECLEILRGETPARAGKAASDTRELSLELSAHMLVTANRCSSLKEARALAFSLLSSGQAYEKFAAMIKAQGGDLSQPLPVAKTSVELRSPTDGWIRFSDIEKMGFACVALGAGRQRSSDIIDPAAGLEIFVKSGDRVAKGDPVLRVFASDENKIAAARPYLQSCFAIVDQAPPAIPLIAGVLS